jgi:hypothetical protein
VHHRTGTSERACGATSHRECDCEPLIGGTIRRKWQAAGQDDEVIWAELECRYAEWMDERASEQAS